MGSFVFVSPGARHRVRRAALAGLSLSALLCAGGQALAQGATQLEEISVEGARAAQPGAGAGAPSGTTAGLLTSASTGTTADGRINPPAGTVGAPPGQESPVGPIDRYVASRTITATKTNTSLLETPQSITVVGQEQIKETGAQTLVQATAYAAGTYAGTFGPDQRQDYFQLRGFVAQDTGLYKDSLQLLQFGFGTFQTEVFGLERIEVLRGPAAILFGAGNPGGIINQVTKRPTLLPFGYAEVGGGSFGQVYGAVDMGGPIGESGEWFYRLTSIGRTGGTQVDGLPSDRAYIAPAFTYRPDPGTTFTVLTSYQRDSTGVTGTFLPYYGTARPNLGAGLRIDRSLNVGDPNVNNFQREQYFAGYEFAHVVDDTWQVRQNLRYSFSDSYENTYLGNGFATGTTLNRFQFGFQDRINLFQVDNQAEARFSDGLFLHDVIFGVDYKNYSQRDNQNGVFFGVPGLNVLAPTSTGPVDRGLPYLIQVPRFTQIGLYAQDQIKLTDRLILIGGLRQDFATTDVKVPFDLFGFTPPTRRDDQALTGRVALLYNLDPGLAPYVAYSTSFQPQIGIDSITRQGLVPDRGEQVEVGFKLQPVGERYALTVAAFDLVRNNPPIPVVTPGLFGTTQLGAVRSRGVEAQFTASLAEGLNVVASATQFDLEFVKGQPQLLGKTPVASPQKFANIFLDYTIPTGEYRGFGFGGGTRYVGSSYADTLNTLKVPEYVLFDATVHYTWDTWRAQITAANIGDKRFVAACQGENACFYGEARRVVASLSYKW